MAVKLLFFAQCSDWMGLGEINFPLSQPQSLESFLQGFHHFEPILKNRAMLRVAINRNLSDFNAEIKNNDEIAFLPPSSGG